MASDTLTIFGTQYSGVTGFKAMNSQSSTLTYYRPDGTSTITANGTYNVAAFASASVLVQPALQTKTGITPSTAAQTISADAGYYGLSTVTVTAIPSAYIIPTGTSVITTNGVYNVAAFASASVSVPSTAPNIQALSVSANGTYTATGGVDGYSPVTVNVIGGGITADNIAERTLSGVMTGSASSIYAYAFAQTQITEANFSQATKLGSFAFASCKSLTTVNMPALTSISSYAFTYCSYLTAVDFPVLTGISDYTFNNCYRLGSVNAPAATYVGGAAFSKCSGLTSINIESVNAVGASAFIGCRFLPEISLPSVSSIGNYAFQQCFCLLSVYLNSVSSVPTLGGSYAFASTPISTYTDYTGGVNGSIYVPASLYDAFTTAANWSIYSARMVSV